MDCGVESGSMLNVPPVTEGTAPPTLAATVYASPDTDQAQFEADKRAVYKHPLFPLLALLFERCELATQSSDAQSSNAFNLDIEAFVQHQERDRKPFLANEPEIDGLMIKAIQVLRIHLLELEKVQELCKDFCNRYITCLKGKMQSENLLRSDYTQGAGVLGALENNNNMLSHGNSESGSDSNSPVQYSISPLQQGAMNPGASVDCMEATVHQQQQRGGPVLTPAEPVRLVAAVSSAPPPPPAVEHPAAHFPHHHAAPYPNGGPPQGASPASENGQFDPHVVHGSTPIGQIGVNLCPVPADASVMSGQLSPAPTTPGGSADDCDSDFTVRVGNKKQKRGVLPKHATSVMRSWLFQHLVHPYPTEDEKRHIAAQTNLTLLQVNNWFINARRRILQPMLDAGATNESQSALHTQKSSRKKLHNSSRRFWPQDIASLQPQLNPGVLSSSDDECDSYSSDGEEGSLVIDGAQPPETNRNGHQTESNTYSNSSESDHP